ncbi:hypothetical protein JHJ32_12040 [Parapedobacter sp. ISTM3]|uniref:hypothetical protein n=1 Tax=Parapedobacter sp. ISTM3 TaxID=2800130 RepID=UPI001908372F|nr:hypothetical protein [Parapedobacter sp. ISTM3]MBK1440721.1 hypothetical protein [Parapedobacter sp. ISTM3]
MRYIRFSCLFFCSLFSLLNALGQPAASDIIQHPLGRHVIGLHGNWHYIVDPYEMGYDDYRREPFENLPSGRGGFYDDRLPKDKTELVEYKFDTTIWKLPIN